MPQIDLYTFNDLVEATLDSFNNTRLARSERNARRAVRTAYRDLPGKRSWSCYLGSGKINTVDQQTSGSIEYDHTGGANERQLTLAGATWPTDVTLYSIRINTVEYEIDQEISSTIVTLSVNNNPGEDIAAGTTYQLYRNVWPLPINFGSMGKFLDVQSVRRPIIMVSPDEYLEMIRRYVSSGQPWVYTIARHPKFVGTLCIKFGPPPSIGRPYDYTYWIKPRDIRIEAYSTGTITTVGTAVTGSGTTWTSAMAGSCIRFSENATALPTAVEGGLSGGDNPYVAQRIIASITDANHLVLDEALDDDLTGKKYLISDYLDIDTTSMLTYLERLAEAEFARLEGREDRGEREQAAREALQWAAAADDRHHAVEGNAPVSTRLGDLASRIDLSF